MEGYFSTGQSPQRAVVPVEEEEDLRRVCPSVLMYQHGFHWRDLTDICVISYAVPMGNVSWMLLQEGRSSKLRLRRGDGQAAHTRNNPHVKRTGVYCA
jgi:hypothetical protein